MRRVPIIDKLTKEAEAEGLTFVEYMHKIATPELRDIMHRMIQAELSQLKKTGNS
jgi:hypothetical protein